MCSWYYHFWMFLQFLDNCLSWYWLYVESICECVNTQKLDWRRRSTCNGFHLDQNESHPKHSSVQSLPLPYHNLQHCQEWSDQSRDLINHFSSKTLKEMYLLIRFRIFDYIIHDLSNVLTIMGILNQTKGKQAICNFEHDDTSVLS